MNNIGFSIITPKIRMHYGAAHDEIEVDGVAFLRRNMSVADFRRFCHIVRDYFCEMGWGNPHESAVIWPPPDEPPHIKTPKRGKRFRKKKRSRHYHKKDRT